MGKEEKEWQRNYVDLADGGQVRYTLLIVDGIYYVRFRPPAGNRTKLSTGETKIAGAREAATRLIREQYQEKPLAIESVSWDAAKAKLEEAMFAARKRPKTIKGYKETLDKLIACFPKTHGPGDVSEKQAGGFNTKYATTRFIRKRKVREGEKAPSYERKAKSQDSRIRTLKAAFGWFVTLGLVACNPFENVHQPQLDKHEVKYVRQEDIAAFFAWLVERFPGWEMPRLFFKVKAVTACRLEDLCSIRSRQLEDGRLVFGADTTKNRSERHAILPADLYAALDAYKGRTFLWERYPPELIAVNREKGFPTHRQNPEFSFRRLYLWVVQLMQDYQNKTGSTLSSHDFRRAAFTRAAERDMHPKRAAVAFDVTAETMLKYYTAADKKKTADEVLGDLAADLLPNE